MRNIQFCEARTKTKIIEIVTTTYKIDLDDDLTLYIDRTAEIHDDGEFPGEDKIQYEFTLVNDETQVFYYDGTTGEGVPWHHYFTASDLKQIEAQIENQRLPANF